MLKQVPLRIPEEHYEQLRDIAHERRISMSELFRNIVADFLKPEETMNQPRPDAVSHDEDLPLLTSRRKRGKSVLFKTE